MRSYNHVIKNLIKKHWLIATYNSNCITRPCVRRMELEVLCSRDFKRGKVTREREACALVRRLLVVSNEPRWLPCHAASVISVLSRLTSKAKRVFRQSMPWNSVLICLQTSSGKLSLILSPTPCTTYLIVIASVYNISADHISCLAWKAQQSKR